MQYFTIIINEDGLICGYNFISEENYLLVKVLNNIVWIFLQYPTYANYAVLKHTSKMKPGYIILQIKSHK